MTWQECGEGHGAVAGPPLAPPARRGARVGRARREGRRRAPSYAGTRPSYDPVGSRVPGHARRDGRRRAPGNISSSSWGRLFLVKQVVFPVGILLQAVVSSFICLYPVVARSKKLQASARPNTATSLFQLHVSYNVLRQASACSEHCMRGSCLIFQRAGALMSAQVIR